LPLAIQQFYSGQPVFLHHSLDQLLRSGGARDDEIHEASIVEESLGDNLFQHRLRGDGIPAARFEDADEGDAPRFQFAGEALLHSPRLHQRVAPQEEDEEEDGGQEGRPRQEWADAAGNGRGHRNLHTLVIVFSLTQVRESHHHGAG